MRALLADRDARLYLGGQALSTIGDSALWLAMGIWVKILTGSSSAAGLVFFAFSAGVLLAPVTGLVADRVRRRPLLIAANLAAAAGVCCLLLAGRGQVWLIYPIMFGYGALNSLIPSWLPVVMAAVGLLGLAIVWFNVGAITLVQRRTPADLLGRVDAALTIAITVPQTVSIALGAALVAVVDYRLLLAVMAAVIAISAVYLAAGRDGANDAAAPVPAPVPVPEQR